MTNKETMQALIDGKKVGESDRRYVYLNMDGKLLCESAVQILDRPEFVLMKLLINENGRVLPEDGPKLRTKRGDLHDDIRNRQ
jgi:hypothetical protein